MKEIKKGRYQHFKGQEYDILGIAAHSETGEELVVYRALYGKKKLWVRPKKMFGEKIVKDGKSVYRFEYCGKK